MITRQQLTAVMGELPMQFSIGELVNRLVALDTPASPAPAAAPPTAEVTDPDPLPVRPANLTPEQAADWDYYMSPEAVALYRRFPVSPEVRALRGIAAGLSEEDKSKTAKEWEAERIKEKHGV